MSYAIKKGLECCANDHESHCNTDCPYGHETGHCISKLASDALAYIETLEARVAEKEAVSCEV